MFCWFLLTLLLSFFLTLLVRQVAFKFGIVDKPGMFRKIHKKETPLLGGLAIFLSFFIIIFLARDKVLAGNLEVSHWLGVFFGGCFIMLGGFLDDKYNLAPRYQIIWPILAIISVVFGGVGIDKITNPLGGFIYFDSVKIFLFKLNEKSYYLTLWSDIVTFIWLLGISYTTKILDGMDGLTTGVTTIGAFIIFLFTMTTKYYQPDIGFASLIFAGACLGFLILNWNPAKIFLGEGGSMFTGFMLGVLAIISGGKIAMALLIMGIPILDVAWAIVRRIKAGKNPFKTSDRLHLHHRLLDLGLGQKKTVLIFYFFSMVFGLSGLFLQSAGKLFALVILFLIMFLTVVMFSCIENRKCKL